LQRFEYDGLICKLRNGINSYWGSWVERPGEGRYTKKREKVDSGMEAVLMAGW
jgi:hypothetical protein